MNDLSSSVLYKRKADNLLDTSTASEILNGYTHIYVTKAAQGSEVAPPCEDQYRYECGGLLVYDIEASTSSEEALKPCEMKGGVREVSRDILYELQKAIPSDYRAYLNMRSLGPQPTNTPSYYLPVPVDRVTLKFNSKFESGNLQKAIKMSDYEYSLRISNDTGTSGNNHWFYFSVTNPRKTKIDFKITNMIKPDQLYSFGMTPAVFSVQRHRNEGLRWHRDTQNVKYETNKGISSLHTLHFTYNFKYPNDTVYFAYSIPHTYEDMIDYTKQVAEENPRIARVNSMCKTLGGNSCPLITITSKIETFMSFEEEAHEWGISAAGRKLLRHRELKAQRVARIQGKEKKNEHIHKKGIVITSRVHSGETVSSFMMKGMIDFLLSDTREARLLRKHFVFKIVPMLNPDGVRHGNYRTSLLGVDLNRRWLNPNKILHPTVFYAKKMLEVFNEKHEVVLYCDMHGHSRKRNVFMYGCNIRSMETMHRRKNLLAKTVPVLMSQKNSFFSFNDCSFRMEKAKISTARIVVFNQFDIAHSYTMEATTFGPSSKEAFGEEFNGSLQMQERHFETLGTDLARVCLSFMSPAVYMKKVQFTSNFLRGRIFKPKKKKQETVAENNIEELERVGKELVRQPPQSFREIYQKEELWTGIEIPRIPEVPEHYEEEPDSGGSDSDHSDIDHVYYLEQAKEAESAIEKHEIKHKNNSKSIILVRGDSPKHSMKQEEKRHLSVQRTSYNPIKPAISPSKINNNRSPRMDIAMKDNTPKIYYPKTSAARSTDREQTEVISRIQLDAIDKSYQTENSRSRNEQGLSYTGRGRTISPSRRELNGRKAINKELQSPRIYRSNKKPFTVYPPKTFNFNGEYSMDFGVLGFNGRDALKKFKFVPKADSRPKVNNHL